MPNSIFSRKSSTASKSSKICQEEYKLLTQALKNIVRRLIICYKSLCCFPLDQIVPPNPRRVKKGLNINLKPGLCQTSEKVLNDIKLIHILPRSRVSFNDPARVKSEICSGKRVRSEISTAKEVISEISKAKKVKSEISSAKQVKNERPPEKDKTKKSKTIIFKEKSKKILDFGSGSIKNKFKYKKKSSGPWRSTVTSVKSKKKSKNDIRSENKWIITKKMIKISNPSNIKWIRLTKPREILTTSSTDNEESAGDGLATPKVSKHIKKIPLRWISMQEQSFSDTHIDSIKKDVDKQVALQMI